MASKKLIKMYSVWPKPNFLLVKKTNKDYENNYHKAMMYAHYELTSAQLKKEILKYLKNNNVDLFNRVESVNEDRLASFGKYIYILNNGGDIPENILNGLMSSLEKTVSIEESKLQKEETIISEPNETFSVKILPNVQDRIKERTREVAGEIEGWIDEFFLNRKTAEVKSIDDFVNLFKITELKSPHIKFMQTIFLRRATEISNMLDGKEKDLIEGYSNFTKTELKKFGQFFKNLLSACGMVQETAKAERAPKKKKPVSQEKLVSKLKYKKEDTALGIVSLNPISIIGATEVWLYNTKVRKLVKYIAADIRGLTVKGASIENFSAKSAEKMVRKPAETLAEFKKASKIKLRTFFEELVTVEVSVTGKINEHHIILKIL